jgi:formylglycine-generating enzyme required for sulfatase activity
MVGNVWEWTRSLEKAYPYDVGDGREDLDSGGLRVLRGGAFYGSAGDVRCAVRYRSYPNDRHWDYGFRVVCGVPIAVRSVAEDGMPLISVPLDSVPLNL